MRTYRLYKSPHGDIVRVKMGFSWQAFFIGSLKASVRRLWLVATIVAALYLSWHWIGGTAPTATSRTIAVALLLLFVYGIYMLFCGVNGNRWLSESLRRRGFVLVGEERG